MTIDEIQACCDREVDLIVKRMQNERTKKQVYDWLLNFRPEDWLYALMILQKFTVVSQTDLFQKCDTLLTRLVSKVPATNSICMMPVAKYGKSATLLTYYMRRSDIYAKLEEEGRLIYLNNEHALKSQLYNDRTTIVLFDDFFGTGGSFNKTYEYLERKSNWTFNRSLDIYGIALYYMSAAKSTIIGRFPHVKILGEEYPKCFSYPPPFFESSFWTNELKKTVQKYADDYSLFVDNGVKHNLGYKDSQALLSFPYNPPNNTVPIIWSIKSNWKPIFPRSEKYKIRQSREFKVQTALSIAKMSLGMPEEMELQNSTRKKTITYGMLRLLNQGVALPVIVGHLGLSGDELDEYIVIAKGLKLLDDQYNLTPKGKQVNQEVIAEVKDFNRKNKQRLPYDDVSGYLPNLFSGKAK